MKNEKDKLNQTILVIVIGFAILSLILKIKVLLTIGILIGLLSLASTTFAGWVSWLWFKVAEILGWINSKILITLVYYIILFPIAALSKLKHKDVLKRRKQSGNGSYFTSRDHNYVSADLENLW